MVTGDIKYLYVIACKTTIKNFFNKIIRKKSQYDHFAICLEINSNKYIVEVDKEVGVTKTLLKTWINLKKDLGWEIDVYKFNGSIKNDPIQYYKNVNRTKFDKRNFNKEALNLLFNKKIFNSEGTKDIRQFKPLELILYILDFATFYKEDIAVLRNTQLFTKLGTL